MAYEIYNEKCPYCGEECECDLVDVGVGMIQCGPYHCENCYATEIGPEMKFEELVDEEGNYGGRGKLLNPEIFSELEIKHGWYGPHSNKISPYANRVNGELVDHITAKKAYDIGMLDEKNI